ncbi:glycosyl hydrolase family 18 protein [Caldalkalibacillus mannanilyticus]|uniref:glycosyl hydrolase family 18 protein n=1 Tax=Caldalkalibacillus mannanilyticus TaxID=1418 RepID=UPI000469E0F9|nr:glycosyl hydrolase family 18 protein [Caldalkalibacillus mannanilyticus]
MNKLIKILTVFLLIIAIIISSVPQSADANAKGKAKAPKFNEPTPVEQPAPVPVEEPIVTPEPGEETVPAPEATPAPAPKDPKIVLGYYVKYWSTDQNSYNSLAQYGDYMNQISMATFNVTATGTVTGDVPSDGVSLADSKNIKSYAAIHNIDNGNFSPQLAHHILSNVNLRTTTITNLLALVKNNGYIGVNMDFENMYASDRANYNQFIRELVNVFHAEGLKVMVSAPAKTADFPSSAWVGAFDYATLGQTADYIQLMTYDQNGSWSNVTGPVAGYNWVENVLKYAVSQIPSEKILMGLPAYGYDWNTTAGSGHKAVTWRNIPNILAATGATPQWDEASKSPYFHYTDSSGHRHVVWYENELSILEKTKLVEKYQLGGVSVWRMGLEDESFWKAVELGLQAQ